MCSATHPLVFALAREFWAGLALLGLSIYYLKQQQQKQQQPPHEQGNKNKKQDDSDATNNSTTLSSLSLHRSHSPHSHKDALRYCLLAWRVHVKSFATLGFVVFGNQAGFIVGIKLAGPVTASVWQPCQPIFTAAICMALGWEPLQPKRIAGILTAFLGCMAMILLKAQSQGSSRTTTTNDSAEQPAESDLATAIHYSALRYILGNILLCTNCLCTSLFVILSKRMLTLYPSLLVTAWSYNFATVYMAVATMLLSTWPAVQTLLCPDCDETGDLWTIPRGAWPALVYYILFASVGSYGLMTWANQYATGTLVMSFSVLQPSTAVVLTIALLVLGVVPVCSAVDATACLEYPSIGTFCGMAGVLLGLTLIIATEATAKKKTTHSGSGISKDEGVQQQQETEDKKSQDQERKVLLSMETEVV